MPLSAARFLSAQAATYEQALAELQAGRKHSHWMWFIFPQLKGLGHSETANYYALDGPASAQAYLSHPVLGERLLTCCSALQAHKHLSAQEILASPDHLKLHSCLTLFNHVAPQVPIFEALLTQFYGGDPDTQTLTLLQAAQTDQ